MNEQANRSRNYADSHPVIRVTSKRFSFSPFASCYGRPETVWGVYSGRLYALSWGDDPVAAYNALRRDACLYDVPEHPIEISGRQSVELLGRVFCRRVSDLAVGRCRYAVACNLDGGILMDGVLMRLEKDRFWYVMANGEFLPWLSAHAAGLEVSIADPATWVLQIQGPRSLDVLAALCSEVAARELSYFHVRSCVIGGYRMLVSRTGWTGELGFELYTLDPVDDGPGLWRTLLAAGQSYGLVASSLDSMGIRRIEAGILDNLTDMDSAMTPYQAGLGRFVDLEAGDFIGRAALRHADRRPLLLGIDCPTAVPIADMAVHSGEQRVGRVTTGAWSPYLQRGIGYVRFDRPGDWLGANVEIASASGGRAVATIVSLPFYDPEKRISRGLPL